MKSGDFWALLILSVMPEKPLELDGMWRSCSDMRGDGLLYVAEFKKDELIEDYYGFEGGGGACDGKRLFHYRRTWGLKFNNFNFMTKYKDSRYIYQPKEGPPNWYGCCRVKNQSAPQLYDFHAMAGDHNLDFKNEFTYRIRGETLETNHKGNKTYLTRIEYPIWFKSKEHFWGFFLKTPSRSK